MTASAATVLDAADALGGAYQLLFARLYEEVVGAARRVTDAAARREDPPSCQEIQQGLVDVVERVAGDAVHLPPMHERRLALYVIVAMADEVFLRAPRLAAWPGRAEWAERPLEQEIFRSHTAGERFFTYLDDALSNRAPLSQDLLAVFLTALALGFCGRYPTGQEPEGYRARIAERLGYEPDPSGNDVARADVALFEHRAGVPAERAALPPVINGIYPIIAVFALWLVVGLGVWIVCTRPLSNSLDAIEAIDKRGGGP